MNASNHAEQVAVPRRELSTRVDIIDRLQTKNRVMQNALADPSQEHATREASF